MPCIFCPTARAILYATLTLSVSSLTLQYITTYTRRRSRDHTGGDIVHDIHDVRNGLFLNKFTHIVLGKDVAFLMVCTTGVICTSESDGADE